MFDFLENPAVVTLLILFIWVPFALGAWLDEVWDPKKTKRSLEKLLHPRRHTHPSRPAAAAT